MNQKCLTGYALTYVFFFFEDISLWRSMAPLAFIYKTQMGLKYSQKIAFLSTLARAPIFIYIKII